MMSNPLDRTAMLHKVTRAGFVLSPESPIVKENRLRGEIDDFAATFFATPLESRREQWQALVDRCTFSPPLSARLLALEPGLDVDVAVGAIGNPRTAQLASHVAGLFVLAPAARAAQRQAVLRSMESDIAGWEEIVKQLQTIAPALAALEPILLRSILSWRERQQQLHRVRQSRQSAATRPAARPTPRPRTPASTGPSTTSNAGKGVGCGAVVLVIAAIRICAGFGSHSTPSYTPPPRIEQPDWQQPVAPIQDRKRDEELQRVIRELEQERKRQDDLDRMRRRLEQPPRRPPVIPGVTPKEPFPPDD